MGDPANLAEFLEDMGLGDYARVLGDNEIDLEAVQLMADSDFQDIGEISPSYVIRSLRTRGLLRQFGIILVGSEVHLASTLS